MGSLQRSRCLPSGQAIVTARHVLLESRLQGGKIKDRHGTPTNRPGSDQIEPSSRGSGAAAFGAETRDDEAVAGGAVAVLRAHGVAKLADLVIAELDDRVAPGAVQVIVRRVAVVVFVGAAVGQPKLAQKAGLDEEAQGPI